MSAEKTKRIRSGMNTQVWHELKTDPECFTASLRGNKPYEIRFNDRDFSASDHVLLRETVHTGKEMAAGKPLIYTGRAMAKVITYVLSGYGLADGWVILSCKNV